MLLRLGLFVSVLVSLSLSDCFVEKAKDKIEFNYLKSSDEISIDHIRVNMKDGNFGDLRSSGCSGKLRLEYKSEKMVQWEAVSMRKTKKKVETKKIDPCEKYELRMVFGGETLELGSIGPYYPRGPRPYTTAKDLTKVALKDKDFFNNKFTYQIAINEDGQTKVSWNEFFCGKTKVVFYDDKEEEVCVQNGEDKFCIMTAEPCQDVGIEVYIKIGDNEKEEYLAKLSEDIRTITTFPNSAKLNSIFNKVTQTVDGINWDFSDFFNDDTETDACIERFGYKLTNDNGEVLGSQDELMRDNEAPVISVNTADKMPCGGTLKMEVSYWLTGREEKYSETFTSKVERPAQETAPSLSVSGTEITVTNLSTCDSADLQLRVEPVETDFQDYEPIQPFQVSDQPTNIRDKMQPCVVYKAKYSDQEEDIEVLHPKALPTVEPLEENDLIKLRVTPATTEDTCKISNYKIQCQKEDSEPFDHEIEIDKEINLPVDYGNSNCTVFAVYEIIGDQKTIEKPVFEDFQVNNSTKLILSSGEKPTTTENAPTTKKVDPVDSPKKSKVTGDQEVEPSAEDVDQGSGSLPLVVGCVAGILAILIIAGTVYYLRKKPERVVSTKAETEKFEIKEEA